MIIFFEVSSDELAFKLPYEPKMKIIASLYRVLQAFSHFLVKKVPKPTFDLPPLTFFCLQRVDFFRIPT